MEDYKRRKKSDKAKEKYEKKGGFSSKHVRIIEALKEKSTSTVQSFQAANAQQKNLFHMLYQTLHHLT